MPLITINKTKFINNLDKIRDKIGSKDKICLVLKNNAYGHGISKISLLAKKYIPIVCVIYVFQMYSYLRTLEKNKNIIFKTK